MKAVAFVAAAALALSLCSCSAFSDKNKEEKIAVPILETKEISYKTCKAEVTDISQEYYQVGTWGYPYSESVVFKTNGQIKSIEVESPCDVKKGDLLCTLYSDDVQEQIEREEIRLDQAKSTVNTLYANNASADEITMAEYDLELEQMTYDHLVESLDDYNVYAPCNGEFTALDRRDQPLNVNSPVSKGSVFGYTSDKSQQYLCVQVYDNQLNNVNFGTAVRLEQGANTSSGTVTDIVYDENGDFSAYTYVITPSDDADLMDFGDVQVVFDIYSRMDTVVIPQKAVKNLSGRTYVNLLVDGVKVEQDIELGIEDNENVEVLSGLSGGEEIILN